MTIYANSLSARFGKRLQVEAQSIYLMGQETIQLFVTIKSSRL
jgi:hypothetical protein